MVLPTTYDLLKNWVGVPVDPYQDFALYLVACCLSLLVMLIPFYIVYILASAAARMKQD